MSYLEKTTTGRVLQPRRTIIHGEHGVGKTTWAAGWPRTILLPAEDGSYNVDVTRGPRLRTGVDVLTAIEEVAASDFETVILDSIDWTEKILQEELDASNFDQSYGRGTIELGHRVSNVLSKLDLCWSRGKHVILVGHSKIVPIERTDGSRYAQHGLKLTKYANEFVCEWADEILYAQRDYLVRSADTKIGGVGVDKKTRSIYTTSSPQWVAKNRFPGLPSQFDLSDVEGYVNFVTNVTEGKSDA